MDFHNEGMPSVKELKLKKPSSDEFSSQEKVYKQQHKKIFTGDKELVKKLYFLTPGLPQGNDINFFPSDEMIFLNKYIHILCQLRGTALKR